jgi:hypothetical protein
MEAREIMKIVTENKNITLTGIAKELGYSKANDKLKDLIIQLVDKENLIKDESEFHPKYSVGQELFEFNEFEEKILDGYTINKLPNGKIKITINNPKKVLTIDGNAILLIVQNKINDSDLHVYVIKMKNGAVKAKEEILKSIFNFRVIKNLVSCVTKDVITNEIIKNIDDVILSQDHLMIYSINAYNKAAKKDRILLAYLKDVMSVGKYWSSKR